MPYLIDSDWVIDHLEQLPEATDLLSTLSGEFMFISIVTYMEVYQGLLRKDDLRAAMEEFLQFTVKVPVLSFSRPVAERAAHLREDLLVLGLSPNRRAYDVLIAATALEHNLTLVTRNVGDYARMPGLKLYGRD